jgi:hypothetical protein
MTTKQHQLEINTQYMINFFDTRQPEYTWYSGPATFLRPSLEDFDTGEQHHVFILPDGNECTFPERSVGRGIK